MIIIVVVVIIIIIYFLDLFGLNINCEIVLFSAPVADVTFLFSSFSYF